MLTKDRKKSKGRFENGFAEISERIGIGVFDERAKKPIKKPGLSFFIWGVILPIAALWFETSTHTLAGVLFDPFPTFFHVLLFSFIPISNLVVFFSVRINMVPYYAITSLMSGMAMGIAVLYSLMFATKFPYLFNNLSAPEKTVYVFLSPLFYAPLFALIPLWTAGQAITLLGARQKAFFDGNHLKHFGHIVILIMVLSIEAPSTLTRIYLSKAVSPFAPTYSARYGCMVTNVVPYEKYDMDAINWLRDWGNKDVLLRACYERGGRATDILGSIYEDQHPVSVELARSVYYRVTGQSFNEAPIPASFRSTLSHMASSASLAHLNRGANDEFDIDTDIAGESVSGVARGLSTSDSEITGTVDADAALASLDWNCTFDNTSEVPREARAKLLLPPGACVSKAKIWIGNMVKEATIQNRSQARATYTDAVMNNKRDPLLVSMAGPDTVLVQCYPVEKGTVTKVQLHIVSPLHLDRNAAKAKLVFPAFSERNFALKKPHSVILNSKSKFTSTDKLAIFDRNPKVTTTYCRSTYTSYPGFCVEAVANKTTRMPQSLSILVDGSIGMEPYIKEVCAGLKNIPVKNIRLIRVMDSESVLINDNLCPPLDSEGKCKNLADALVALEQVKCRGGQDNSVSLSRIFAASNPMRGRHQSVLWIHGTQPVCDPQADAYLKQTFETLKGNTHGDLLFDYQVKPGSNSLLQGMDLESTTSRVQSVLSTGHPKEDLEAFFATMKEFGESDPHESFAGLDFLSRQGTPVGSHATTTDLCILKAYDQAMYEFAEMGYQGETIHSLVNHYNLVSPVSSLVVTEETPEFKIQTFVKGNTAAACITLCEPTAVQCEDEVCEEAVSDHAPSTSMQKQIAMPTATPAPKAKERDYRRKASVRADREEMGEVRVYERRGRHAAVGGFVGGNKSMPGAAGNTAEFGGKLYNSAPARINCDELSAKKESSDAAVYSDGQGALPHSSVPCDKSKDCEAMWSRSGAAPMQDAKLDQNKNGLLEGVTRKLNSLSQAASSADYEKSTVTEQESGLKGAPVDPRYGQSNQADRFSQYRNNRTHHNVWMPFAIIAALLGLIAFFARSNRK